MIFVIFACSLMAGVSLPFFQNIILLAIVMAPMMEIMVIIGRSHHYNNINIKNANNRTGHIYYTIIRQMHVLVSTKTIINRIFDYIMQSSCQPSRPSSVQLGDILSVIRSTVNLIEVEQCDN